MTCADAKYQSNKNVSKEQQTKPNKQTKVKQVKTWFGQPEVAYLTKHDLINNERTVLFTSKWIYLQIKKKEEEEEMFSFCWNHDMICATSYLYNLEIPGRRGHSRKLIPPRWPGNVLLHSWKRSEGGVGLPAVFVIHSFDKYLQCTFLIDYLLQLLSMQPDMPTHNPPVTWYW